MTEKELNILRIKAIQELIELKESADAENAHSSADKVLTDFLEAIGEKEIAVAYNELDKWYA